MCFAFMEIIIFFIITLPFRIFTLSPYLKKYTQLVRIFRNIESLEIELKIFNQILLVKGLRFKFELVQKFNQVFVQLKILNFNELKIKQKYYLGLTHKFSIEFKLPGEFYSLYLLFLVAKLLYNSHCLSASQSVHNAMGET